MEFIFRPKNYDKWSIDAADKIAKTIDSCESEHHLECAKKMIENFALVTALEDIDSKSIEDIINLFWFKLKSQQILISKRYASN